MSINLANFIHAVLTDTYQLAMLYVEGVDCMLTQQNDTFSIMPIFHSRVTLDDSLRTATAEVVQ